MPLCGIIERNFREAGNFEATGAEDVLFFGQAAEVARFSSRSRQHLETFRSPGANHH